jgi:hypothetical protein
MMWRITKLMADLQDIHQKFGDTCVSAKRLCWGATALWADERDRREAEAPLLSEYQREGGATP